MSDLEDYSLSIIKDFPRWMFESEDACLFSSMPLSLSNELIVQMIDKHLDWKKIVPELDEQVRDDDYFSSLSSSMTFVLGDHFVDGIFVSIC